MVVNLPDILLCLLPPPGRNVARLIMGRGAGCCPPGFCHTPLEYPGHGLGATEIQDGQRGPVLGGLQSNQIK